MKSEERSELQEQVIDSICCFKIIGVFLELLDQRTHFDGLGTSAENEHYLLHLSFFFYILFPRWHIMTHRREQFIYILAFRNSIKKMEHNVCLSDICIILFWPYLVNNNNIISFLNSTLQLHLLDAKIRML